MSGEGGLDTFFFHALGSMQGSCLLCQLSGIDFHRHATRHASMNSNLTQIGLSMAYLEIWRRMESQSISSAYVVEDDAIFHDDFDALFPLVSLNKLINYTPLGVGLKEPPLWPQH